MLGPLALLCLHACEGGQDAPPTKHCGINQSQAQHACIHGTAGPFADLDGRLDQPIALASALHTLYTVSLSPSADGAFNGQFRFTSRRPGLWALLFSPQVALTGQRDSGSVLNVELSTNATSCRFFSVGHVVRLGQDESVTLRVSNVSAPTLSFLPERLGTSWEAALETESCGAGPADAAVDASLFDLGAGPESGPADGASLEANHALPEIQPQATSPEAGAQAGAVCRFDGPCTRDEECCEYCHDGDHCH